MGKRKSEIIRRVGKNGWLRLVRNTTRKGLESYALRFYKFGLNRNFEKTIAHTERKALDILSKLKKAGIPDLKSNIEKENWIESNTVPPPNRSANSLRKDINIEFGFSRLGRKLRDHCKEYCGKRIERQSKNKRVTICWRLQALAGKDEFLNNRIVRAYFKKHTQYRGKHLSPVTLQNAKGEIRTIAKAIGVKDVEGLFKGVDIPTKAQLKDEGTSFGEKNRRHLELYEVEPFIENLFNFQDEEKWNERSGLFLQLLVGWRPQEVACAEFLDSSLYVNGTWNNGRKKSLKTASKGVEEIIVARDPIIDAYLFLTDCKPGPIVTKSGHKVFKEIVTKTIGARAAKGLDRYCLRHTALTWLVKCLPTKDVCDIAGHMGPRMLQDHYTNKRVKDQRKWTEAMPLNFKLIPKDWFGFLLECVIIAKWPALKKTGEAPKNDKDFQKLAKILNTLKVKRPELDLF